MATYPCPSRVDDIASPCLDMKQVQDALDVIEDVRVSVNRFLTIEGLPNVPVLDLPELLITPCPLSAQLLKHIADYIRLLFNTGRVYKRTVDGAGDEWPFPTTVEEIEQLEDCDAFWANWGEIYACMSLDTNRWGAAFGDPQVLPTCVDKVTWNDFWLSVNCMLPTSPCSPCPCPVCDRGSCLPCRRCITILVEYDTDKYMLTEVETATSPGECLIIYEGSGPFVDVDGDIVAGYRVYEAHVELAKGWVFYKVTIVKDDPAGYTATHVFYGESFGSDSPSMPCSEVPHDGTLVYASTQKMYEDIGYTEVGEMQISISSGFAISNDPWKGVLAKYRLRLADILECDRCALSGSPGTDGVMMLFGPSLTLETAGVTLHGREFSATVTYHSGEHMYMLELKCGVGAVYWRGYKQGCGGPDGEYTDDPEYDNCFAGPVHIDPY